MPTTKFPPHRKRNTQICVKFTDRELDIIDQLQRSRSYGSRAKVLRQCALKAAERAGIRSQVK